MAELTNDLVTHVAIKARFVPVPGLDRPDGWILY